ncbi:MAG: hypothetical protein V4649_08110 [Bacteroidota bacterium]
MKQLFILITVLAYSLQAIAQKEECEHHYFRNKAISTSACYGKGFNSGKARAFDKSGKVIYEKGIRKFAGHSYVQFSYYESGAVKKAEWSDAPDAGIQWYKSVTTFGEDGKVTGYTEQSHDGLRNVSPLKTMPDTGYKPPVVTPRQPKKKEIVACAVIYSSEIWFINRSKQAAIVHADSKSAGGESYTVRLKPGASAKAGAMIQAQRFENPERFFYFSAVPEVEGKRRLPQITFDHEEQDGKEKRRYYFEVR